MDDRNSKGEDKGKSAAGMKNAGTISAAQAEANEVSLDEALETSVRDPEDEARKKRKKKFTNIGIGIGAVLLIAFFVHACQPAKAGIGFGICSTFLELNTIYPHTLRYNSLESSRTAVRIYFTHVDPFGVYRQEMIECTFVADATLGMKLSEVKRNRRPVDPAVVSAFNVTLPTIVGSDPYLVAPPNWKNPLVKE